MAGEKPLETASSRLEFEDIAKDLWNLLGRVQQAVDYYVAAGLQFTGPNYTGAAADPKADSLYYALSLLVQDSNLGPNPWPDFNYKRIYKTNIAEGMRRGGS